MSMKIAALAAALALTGTAWAGEHPKEHPTGKKEHPKKSKASAKQWVKDKKTMGAFVTAVEDYVEAKRKEEGAFRVHDSELDKTWDLKLVKIHKKRIARLGENEFFACADFETVGKGKKKRLDLDFFVSRNAAGEFVVDEIPVHKLEGKPRYTYNAANQRVPVESEKKSAEHPKAGGKEHPEHPH